MADTVQVPELQQENYHGKVHWFRSTIFQIIVVGGVFFCVCFFDWMREESADSCFWCRRRCVFDLLFFDERWANKLDG